MSEWAIFGVISSLFAFIVAICGPILKLNTTITKLIVKLDSLEQRYLTFETVYEKGHHELTEKIGEQNKAITNHEERIKALEKD